MANQQSMCPNCGELIAYERFHAGFSDLGYMYCDRDATVITWNSYDPIYNKLVGPTHPWMLSESAQHVVESNVIRCRCGGHFSFAALPRCPHCLGIVPEFVSGDRAYVSITSTRIDGEREQIWRSVVDGWDFIETVNRSGATIQIVKDEFRRRHPELADVPDASIRVDHMLTGRNPVASAYRFWIKRALPMTDSND